MRVVSTSVLAAIFALSAIGIASADYNGDVKTCNVPAANPEAAIPACTRLLQNPRKGVNVQTTFNLRGLAWYAKNDRDRALADYTRSIDVDPTATNAKHAYKNRANVWMDKGDLDRSFEDFESYIKLDPGDYGIYYNRALLWQLRNRSDLAQLDLDRSIARNKSYATAWNSKGLIHTKAGEYDRALECFNKVIELEPRGAKGYAIRGWYWRQRGNLDQALKDADRSIVLKTDKTDGLQFYLRGETLRYRGLLDRSLADFDEALRREPTKIYINVARGLAFEKMGNLEEARKQFERAVNENPYHDAAAEIDFIEARATASARLAALGSGKSQPTILSAPATVSNSTSVPTPAIAAPILTQPLSPVRARASAKQLRRIALVIGNSDYKNVPALINPRKDSEAIAASLRNIGFETVTLANDVTREKLIEALRTFANEAENSDWAMVYYAGHGMEVNGTNYLIPVDAKLTVDRDVEFEAVPLSQVLRATDPARKIKLIMLDACRDNPFTLRKTAPPDALAVNTSTAGGTVASRSTNGRGLAEVKVTGATLVVYAAKEGQVALDGEGGNSPFAVAVVQRLATPGVEINKLFRLVRDDVMEATAGRQEPYTYGSLPGKEDFFFVSK